MPLGIVDGEDEMKVIRWAVCARKYRVRKKSSIPSRST